MRHMWDEVDPAFDPEGHLLGARHRSGHLRPQRAGLAGGPAGRSACERIPRLDLAQEFLACFRDQAVRKPGSTAAAAVDSGIAERIAANVLDG